MDTVVFLPFSFQIVGWGIFLIFLLTVSALVSGSEAALFSLTPNDIGKLKKNQSRSSEAALTLLSMPNYLLATILTMNNLVNICAVLVTNRIVDLIVTFNDSSILRFIIKVIIVTFILLLFGEIMPKILATSNPMRFTKIIAVPLLYLKNFFKPVSYVLIHSGSHIHEAVSRKKGNISMDEISDALEIAETQNAEDKKILQGIVDFINTEVSDVLKPRVDVVAVDMGASFAQVRKTIMESGFSRIPVYEGYLDNIKGVLYVKDLIPHLSKENFQWQKLLRKPYIVPEHKKINDLLEEFQREKVHLGIVVDEYGSVQGIVSMEDILEEIVGEISDESDLQEERYYTKIAPDVFLFEGKTHLNDFLKILGFEEDYLDEAREDAETLAGFMLELKRDFLATDDTVEYGPLVMQVASLEGRRIKRVKVTVKKE